MVMFDFGTFGEDPADMLSVPHALPRPVRSQVMSEYLITGGGSFDHRSRWPARFLLTVTILPFLIDEHIWGDTLKLLTILFLIKLSSVNSSIP